MVRLSIVPANTNFDFVGRRRLAYPLSALLIILSIGAFFTQGLNFGIDFRGGILIEIKTEGPANVAELRSTVGGLGLGEVQVQEFGAPDDVLIRIQQQDGAESEQLQAINILKDALGDQVAEYRRTEFVGPTVGAELISSAIWAVVLAIGAILIYIWFRFEWQFGVGAVIALTHDVVTTIGLFAFTQLEFNLATVAAILTIAGYSINDTVVIYDRVREELRRYKKLDMPALLNLAANRTLSRTFMTSVTTLIALIALAVFGGTIIRDFALAMIWGVIIGTYSSVFVAVPVLLALNLSRQSLSAGLDESEQVEAPEDDVPDTPSDK
ncbi:MAG: protein translocase subunit SecF [Rhodospirillaceae bacterium]|nr:protein translocase subunit SecF [Rhodospirillaceae bacterium]MBT4771473.1 protein translocase subunit SecF [Rhodospirillaceae bacterium]MBT5356772.1 protein translocase subunit SecF [Rhodospirillaceae bacterium]MBT5770745.1 protein translocase subunit SecF [Rhodospirillaceae bacterium]MBT6311253.1 protein translocase subunit SecF [Rhodospirillaceae bacterium]